MQGAIAALAIGGVLVLGRDSLYFYNGPGGDSWKIGHGKVHLFNAHFDRDLEKARKKALDLVNRDREANGLKPLAADIRLEELAQNHAEDMAQRNYLSDFSPEGKSPSDRFIQLGGQGFVAQNIAWREEEAQVNYRQLSLIERGLMYDRRDRENLLNPQFNQFGFGIAVAPKDGEIYAVQLFRNDGTVAAQTTNASVSQSPKTATPGAQPQTMGDPFREAVNAAMAAAVAAQTAQTPQQWAIVAGSWQRAVTNMKAVAPDHPRHAIAQQKAAEYAKNFDYARNNAGNAFAVQQPATLPVKAPVQKSGQNSAQDLARTPASNPAQNLPQNSGQPPNQPSASQPGDLAANPPAAQPDWGELPGTDAFDDMAQWLKGDRQGMWFKLILTLGGAAALIFILTLEPGQWGDDDSPPPPRQDVAWHVRARQEVQKFLAVKGWFNDTPQYKLTAARPAQQVQRKLFRELLSLTQNEQVAIALIKDSMRSNPRQPANWCCEQVIKELRKDAPPTRSANRVA
jgi:uncharacterized protein YkwD